MGGVLRPPLERDFISSPSLKGQLWAKHQTGADRSGRAKWPVAKAATSILSFSQSECRKSEKINCMRMLIIIKHELFSSSDLHDVQTPTRNVLFFLSAVGLLVDVFQFYQNVLFFHRVHRFLLFSISQAGLLLALC